MLRVAVLLCVVAATYGWGASEEAVKKYGYMKIMQSCLGEEVVSQWMSKYMDATTKCKNEGVSMTDLPSYRQYLMELRSGASKPEYVPVPVPYYFPQQGQMNQFMASQNPFQSMNRVKRSEHASLDHLEEKMKAKLGNITCVLREMNLMDENNQPIYDTAIQWVKELQVADELKADLLDAMEMCQDFSMCLPVEKCKSPIKKEFGQAMSFMKCVNMQKANVCMKHDMRKYAAEMGKTDYADDEMMQEIQEFEQALM